MNWCPSSFFAQTHPFLSKIHTKETVSISIFDHSNESKNKTNHSFHEFSAAADYKCEMIGPFITACPIEGGSASNENPFNHNYHFFIPMYMAQKKSATEIQMIPTNSQLFYRINFKFQASLTCSNFHKNILSVRNYLNSYTNEVPPISLPISLLDNDNLLENNCVFEIVNNKLMFKNEENKFFEPSSSPLSSNSFSNSNLNSLTFSLPPPVKIKSDTLIIPPFDFYTLNDAVFFRAGCLLGKTSKMNFIVFNSTDSLYFVITSLYIIANKLLMRRLKSKEFVLSCQIPSKEIDNDQIVGPKIEFVNNKIKYQNLISPKDEKDITHKVEHKLPIKVPPSASSELSFLSFDSPVKRNVYIFNSENSKNSNLRFTNPKLNNDIKINNKNNSQKEDHFSAQKLKLLSLYRESNSAQIDQFKNKMADERNVFVNLKQDVEPKQVLYSYLNDSFISDSTLHLCKRLNYKYGKIKKAIPGQKIFDLMNDIIFSLPIIIDPKDSKFINLCEIISSAFCVYYSNQKINLFENLKTLLTNNIKILNCIPNRKALFSDADDNNNNTSFSVFIQRLIIHHLFHDFLRIVTSNKDWVFENYSFLSPIRSMLFLEYLKIITFPLQHREFIFSCSNNNQKHSKFSIKCVNDFSSSLLTRNSGNLFSFTEYIDTEIRLISAHLNSSFEQKIELDEELFYLLIFKIFCFLKDGFKHPKSPILLEMRHFWYSLQLTSSMDFKFDEFTAFYLSVKKMSSSETATNDVKVANVIYDGLVCGMMSSWILLISQTAQQNEIYEVNAPILNQNQVMTAVDSLNSLAFQYFCSMKFDDKKICFYNSK